MQKLKKMEEIVEDKKIPIRLAYTKSNNAPGILSLWYIELAGRFYCATQKDAKIVDFLKQSPICGFEIAADRPPYKGIRGKGVARIFEKRGNEILQLLIEKYLGQKESKLSHFLKKNSASEVAIEITPKKIFSYDYTKRMEDI